MQNYYAGDNVKWRNENKLERKLLGIVKTNSKKKSVWKRLTCDIDRDHCESRQWYSSNILSSNPQHKVPGGLVVQGLCHQDGGWTILTVGGQVEAHRHVGLWDHAVLQVVSYPGIPEGGGGFDGLFETKNMIGGEISI